MKSTWCLDFLAGLCHEDNKSGAAFSDYTTEITEEITFIYLLQPTTLEAIDRDRKKIKPDSGKRDYSRVPELLLKAKTSERRQLMAQRLHSRHIPVHEGAAAMGISPNTYSDLVK